MSRICVCVTGQLRHSDEGLWKLKAVTDELDATFVFSVWDTIGSKTDGALNMDQVPRIFEGDAGDALPVRWLGYKNLWQSLPVLYEKRVQSFEHHSAESISARVRAIFPHAVVDVEAADLLQLEFPNPGEDKNSLRMLYKFWRANEIKRRLERNSTRFDYVIRLRPDLMLLHVDLETIARHAEQKTILVDAFVPDGAFVYDNFAAGTSEAMDAYCSLFGRALAIPQQWDHIHRELHHHIERVGLRYALYPHLGGLVQDKRVSAAEVGETLDIARDRGEDWTRTHEVTRAAMHMAALTTRGEPLAALETLSLPIGVDSRDVHDLDGYLASAAKAFRDIGEHATAAACLGVSMHLRHASPAAWPTWATGIVVDAIATAGRLEPTCDVESLSRSILTAIDFRRIPVHQPLEAALGPLPDVVFGQIRGLMSDPRFQARLIRSLAALDRYDASFSLVTSFTGDPAAKHLLILTLKEGRAERAGDLDAVILSIEERLSHVPGDMQSIYRLADFLKTRGRYAEAEHWQRRAVALDPAHAGALRQMAEISLQLGKVDDASSQIQRALQLDGSSSDARVLSAYIAWRRTGQDGAASEIVRPPEGYAPRASFLKLPDFDRFYTDGFAPAVASP